MPTYDYRCRTCGREVEVKHGIHEQGPTICESCGGIMRKALSSPAILFKGSGWAKKDARSAATSTSRGSANEAASGAKDLSPAAGSSDGRSGGGASADAGRSGGGASADAGKPATTTNKTD